MRGFVGHGVGFEFHEAPQVPHFGRPGTGIPLVPGMVFTIEPMINLGRRELEILAGDYKAAATDSLKKCATLFGVGLHLYNGDKPPAGRIEHGGSGSRKPVQAPPGRTEMMTGGEETATAGSPRHNTISF